MDEVQLGVGAAFQTRRYRLEDDVLTLPSGPTSFQDPIGEETSVPIYARIAWRPTPRMNFGIIAGVSVGGKVRVEDEDGDRIDQEDLDPAPTVGITGTILF